MSEAKINLQQLLPKSSSTSVVFPLKKEGSKSFYSMLEFNPTQTDGVITKEEVAAYLEKLTACPNFEWAFPKTLVIFLGILTIISSAVAFTYWIILIVNLIRWNTPALLSLLITAIILTLVYKIIDWYGKKVAESSLKIFNKRKEDMGIIMAKINEELAGRLIRFTDGIFFATLELDYVARAYEN